MDESAPTAGIAAGADPGVCKNQCVVLPSILSRAEFIPESDLESPAEARATRLPVVRVRSGRWPDLRVVAAEVVAVEHVEHIDEQAGARAAAELESLLQARVHVLVPEHVPDPEEGTGRRLEDIRLLLSYAKAAAGVRGVDCNTRGEIHDAAEQEVVRQPDDRIGHDRVALIVRRAEPRPVADRRIPVVEAPEDILALTLLFRLRERVRETTAPPRLHGQRTLHLELQRVVPRLHPIVGDEDG